MAGLVPAIHVFVTSTQKDVDARHKAGHDESVFTKLGVRLLLALLAGTNSLILRPVLGNCGSASTYGLGDRDAIDPERTKSVFTDRAVVSLEARDDVLQCPVAGLRV